AVRGKPKVLRNNFLADPVVGWLVVVGGPGLGSFRPIFEGNNAVGRSKDQRIPIDFGDTTISSEEQAYIRDDSADRAFLFVPNLSKTNIVAINDKKPTGAVKRRAPDQSGQHQIRARALQLADDQGGSTDHREVPDFRGTGRSRLALAVHAGLQVPLRHYRHFGEVPNAGDRDGG